MNSLKFKQQVGFTASVQELAEIMDAHSRIKKLRIAFFISLERHP